MTLNDFLPLILPRVKGCPDILATFNTRMAIIELCQKALIWREYQDPITTAALTTAYDFEVPNGQQVFKLLSLTLGGTEVSVVDPNTGKTMDALGETRPYAYGAFSGFELRPAQEAGLQVVTYSVVAPTFTATTIPDSMSRYMEAIANGALSRILMTNSKEYGDMAGAAVAKALWDDAIAEAKNDALTGFSRSTVRTSKVWF